MQTLFAADIGGTKSELAVFPVDNKRHQPLFQKRYNNADFSGVEEVFKLFFNESEYLPEIACIAVAGLVVGRRAQMTNLPWEIDCGHLEKEFGIDKITLLNDLTAVCSSLPLLNASDFDTLQAGSNDDGAVKGVVAPGTGLGEGYLVEIGGHHFAQGSEGGHVDFAPTNDEQAALLSWMQVKTRPVSYETLIAGPGIANLYDFCREYHRIAESPLVVATMADKQDRVPAIVGGAIRDPHCPLCAHAINLFLSILGSEAGNMALKVYAKGGIFLGGGILPRLVGKVSFEGFVSSFLSKGVMAPFMKEIPIHLIKRKDAALLGAFSFARENLLS